MAYTTILSERKSTVGSPYCFYTVLYSQAGRSATTVTLDIQVKAHLQYAESFYGYSLTGALTVAGTTFSIPLKGNETWSGTTVHTIDKRITVSAAAGTTSLGASFKVTGGDSSATLTQTTCSNIGITRYYTKASISASNALIGEDVTISLSGKYPSTAICELSYEFEGLKKTLGTTADTSYPWELSKHTEEQDEL